MTRNDDHPDFLPPRESDLPRPAGPAERPEPETPLPPPPSGPPLPAEQPGAHDSGSRKTVALKVGLLVAIPLLVIALIVLAVVGLRSLSGSLNKQVAAGPSDPPTPSQPATTTRPPTPTPSPSRTPTQAVVKGWQPVVHAKRGVAYDVPRDWEVNTPTTIVGFETNGNRLAMTGSADFASGYCTDEGSGIWRGVSGVAAAPKSGSLPSVAKVAASTWGNVYDDPSKGIHAVADAGEPKPLHVKGAKAYHSRVEVTVTGGDACTPPKALVDVVAVRGGATNGIFVLVADQGDKLDEARTTLDKIVSSVRTYKK